MRYPVITPEQAVKVYSLGKIKHSQELEKIRIMGGRDEELSPKELLCRRITDRVKHKVTIQKRYKWFWQLMKCNKELLEYLNDRE